MNYPNKYIDLVKVRKFAKLADEEELALFCEHVKQYMENTPQCIDGELLAIIKKITTLKPYHSKYNHPHSKGLTNDSESFDEWRADVYIKIKKLFYYKSANSTFTHDRVIRNIMQFIKEYC